MVGSNRCCADQSRAARFSLDGILGEADLVFLFCPFFGFPMIAPETSSNARMEGFRCFNYFSSCSVDQVACCFVEVQCRARVCSLVFFFWLGGKIDGGKRTFDSEFCGAHGKGAGDMRSPVDPGFSAPWAQLDPLPPRDASWTQRCLQISKSISCLARYPDRRPTGLVSGFCR